VATQHNSKPKQPCNAAQPIRHVPRCQAWQRSCACRTFQTGLQRWRTPEAESCSVATSSTRTMVYSQIWCTTQAGRDTCVGFPTVPHRRAPHLPQRLHTRRWPRQSPGHVRGDIRSFCQQLWRAVLQKVQHAATQRGLPRGCILAGAAAGVYNLDTRDKDGTGVRSHDTKALQRWVGTRATRLAWFHCSLKTIDSNRTCTGSVLAYTKAAARIRCAT